MLRIKIVANDILQSRLFFLANEKFRGEVRSVRREIPIEEQESDNSDFIPRARNHSGFA